MKNHHIGMLFNAYFIIFLLFIQKHILSVTDKIMWYEISSTAIGAIIFTLIALEMVAIIIKVPKILSRANAKAKDEVIDGLQGLWIGRTATSIFFTVLAFTASGIDIFISDMLVLYIIFGTIIKEALLLKYITFHAHKTYSPDETTYSKPELIADAIIWIYVPIAFTAINGAFSPLLGPLKGLPITEMAGQAFIYAICFLMIIYPLQITYIIEAIVIIDTTKERLAWLGSIALTLLIVIAQIY